jgi:hypothetical protein
MQAPRNVGGNVTSKSALSPRNQVDAASFSLTGATINKADAHSALFVVATGPSTGTPDSVAVSYKLQDSADGSSWADVATSTKNPAVTGAIAAASSRSFLEVDLSDLRENVRLAFTVAHVGGSSPATGLSAECVVGGLINNPPTHA